MLPTPSLSGGRSLWAPCRGENPACVPFRLACGKFHSVLLTVSILWFGWHSVLYIFAPGMCIIKKNRVFGSQRMVSEYILNPISPAGSTSSVRKRKYLFIYLFERYKTLSELEIPSCKISKCLSGSGPC